MCQTLYMKALCEMSHAIATTIIISTPNSYSLCARHWAKHFIFMHSYRNIFNSYKRGTIIILSIVVMEKLRLGEAKGLAQGHVANK